MPRKYPWRRLALFAMSLPVDLVMWAAILVIWALWGTKLRWVEWSLWCELKPESWPARTWYRYVQNGRPIENPEQHQAVHGRWRTWGGTTFGHGGFYGPGIGSASGYGNEVEVHEHVHVEQYEAWMFASWVLSLPPWITLLALGHPTAATLVALGIWMGGGLIRSLAGNAVAWFRGESSYRGAAHEEAAYAIAADYVRKKHGL